MEIHRQYLILRRRWLLLVIGVGVAASMAFLYTRSQPDEFEATTTVAVGHTGVGDYNQLLVDQNQTAAYAFRATTLEFLRGVAGSLPFPVTAEELQERLSVAADQVATRLQISVRDHDANRATQIAEAVASGLLAAGSTIDDQADALERAATQIRATVVTAMQSALSDVARLSSGGPLTPAQQAQLDAAWNRVALYGQLMTSYRGLGTPDGMPRLEVLEPAVVPTDPVAPRPVLTTLLAALVALMAGIGLAFLREYSEHPVRDADDAMDATGLPILGAIRGRSRVRIIGRGPRLTMLLDGHSADAEAYRSLRANLGFAAAERQIKTLVVTGTTTPEATTITACNLAVAFAQVGRKVLLVDANLRQPGIHKQFGLTNGRGLSTLLVDPAASPADVVREVPNANLRVLTSGLLPPDSTALLESTAMPRLLADLASDVDLVIVDSAPMAAGPDGAILAGMADAVILVIDTDHGNAEASRRSAHDLHRARARVLGAVVYGSSSPGTVAVVNEFVPPSVVGSRERAAADVDQRVDSA